MLDHEIVGELCCLDHIYWSFCHTEELLLYFTFAKISSRLLFADFLFEKTEEDDDLALSAAFLFRPDGLPPVARPPAAAPSPPVAPPAVAWVSTTSAKTFFALSFNARLFNDCFLFLPLTRLTTSGKAASKTFCPTCSTKGPTYFFKSGTAVRPTRCAKAPNLAPEPTVLGAGETYLHYYWPSEMRSTNPWWRRWGCWWWWWWWWYLHRTRTTAHKSWL